MPHFVIHARFSTKPEKRDQFIAKYKEIAAEARQNEPGCIAFHLSEEPAKPNSFALFELSPHLHILATADTRQQLTRLGCSETCRLTATPPRAAASRHRSKWSAHYLPYPNASYSLICLIVGCCGVGSGTRIRLLGR